MSDLLLAFLDCEFGGLDVEKHDITEIAVVVTDYRLAELARGQWRVWAHPERIDPQAAKIFGYDEALWAQAPKVSQVLGELVELLPKGGLIVPAGQNVRMDVIFLERAFQSCKIPYPFDYHVIDLATLYYSWSLVAGHSVPALSLRQAATEAGLLQGAVAHRAMDDTLLTLETFRHFIGRLAARDPAEPVPLAGSGDGGKDVVEVVGEPSTPSSTEGSPRSPQS